MTFGDMKNVFTHPTRQTPKSGPKLVDMNSEPAAWDDAVIEIRVGENTTFRSDSLAIAQAFLVSLEKLQVEMTVGVNRVKTGADIAYLILERAAA